MKTFLTLSLACLILTFVAFGQTDGNGNTGTTKLTADLSPANLVPPLTDGTGSATAEIEVTMISGGTTGSNSAVVNFDVTLDGVQVTDITGLSINEGAAGLNGQPVVQTTFGTEEAPTGETLTGQIMVTGSAALESLQGVLDNPEDFYVVLTTSTNPAGAMRGQLEAGDDNGGEIEDLNTKVDSIQAQLNLIQSMIRTIGVSIGIPPENLPAPEENTDTSGGTDTGSTQ